jgi:hypothetical protein
VRQRRVVNGLVDLRNAALHQSFGCRHID